jgi:hypothetical protein
VRCFDSLSSHLAFGYQWPMFCISSARKRGDKQTRLGQQKFDQILEGSHREIIWMIPVSSQIFSFFKRNFRRCCTTACNWHQRKWFHRRHFTPTGRCNRQHSKLSHKHADATSSSRLNTSKDQIHQSLINRPVWLSFKMPATSTILIKNIWLSHSVYSTALWIAPLTTLGPGRQVWKCEVWSGQI